MQNFSPVFDINAIKRHQKGLTKEFGGIVAPYYKLLTEGREGQPVKIDTTKTDTIVLLADGEASTKAFGLLTQNVIDDSTYGQLRGYHFANDTRARPGSPVGVLTGQGYASTINYEGTGSKGAPAYYNATTGRLTAATTGGATNKLPVIFDQDFDASVNENLYDSTAYTQPVRIRFNFPLV